MNYLEGEATYHDRLSGLIETAAKAIGDVAEVDIREDTHGISITVHRESWTTIERREDREDKAGA